MAVKKFISKHWVILLYTVIFLSPCLFISLSIWWMSNPNPIEVIHGDTSDLNQVVQQFGTSLIRNDFKAAGEVIDTEADEKFALWVRNHKEVKECRPSFKFENNGPKVGFNWSDPQNASNADFRYWCTDYNISVTNIKIKKENNRFWIVDWDMPKERFLK